MESFTLALNPSPSTVVLDEHQLAATLGMSVHWVRKDRRTKRLLPFYKIGDCVRYNSQRVFEALAAVEEGGAAPIPRNKRGV